MSDVSLHQFLVLYAWFPLTVLLLFMLLIARFYQKFSGERMYFRLYAVEVALFGVIAVRYANVGVVSGDRVMDILSITAGIILLFLSTVLYKRMLTQTKKKG